MEFIVEKIGMSRTISVPSKAVTILKVLDTKVCEVKNDEKSVVSYAKGKKTNKAIQGKQAKYNLSKEFNRFASINVANTEPGDIDTKPLEDAKTLKSTFTTKGKGFTGVVKRWNFAGGRASHGHRMGKRTGSIGNAEWPGRVMPGKKMPGQYGNVTASVKSEVISFDKNTKVLIVAGSISGPNGAIGKIKVSR
ncbi:MAG: 50S ribosomal protein L3 [Campylobacteraceae bacterium 4484_166]|nr:MAG: 50S ribosomal protein L3 [Campylobacteraceae bacterium 4484_166]